MKTTIISIVCVILLAIAGGVASAQSWDAGLTTGLTSVDVTQSGFDYTLILTNMTGLPGDPTVDYDVLVWSLEPFNLPAPETIVEMPSGWTWDGGHWQMFEVADASQKYYTPPALAPGASATFRYTSTLLVSANSGGPSDGSPGFLSHVAAVDPTRPGSDTQRWYEYYPTDRPQTWFDRSGTRIIPPPPVPEPSTILGFALGLAGTIASALRRRMNP